ncbi:RhoGAP domain containing protein [Histomonas meleagridis]|uniref:RhoGAP domain containing protein n=1 Tax=Histomonas meleagridis TaxID=135588 RepID=UPI00355A401A|nr:RhoGAP domain containing protein [Histomonas meleagridis]KAH0805975.1 RhoGAP domain containing protein [Histomonas meleagridis]
MTVSYIQIHFPFRLENTNNLQIQVTSKMLVSDLIEASLKFLGDDFTSDRDLYGIFVKPYNLWLLPNLLISEYSKSLAPPSIQPILEFRHKDPRAVKITFLNFQTIIYCDPIRTVGTIIQETVKRVRGRHIATANWTDEEKVIYQGYEPIDKSKPISTIFTELSDVPVLTLRREILPTKTSIFKGNIIDALERDSIDGKVPFFFSKLLELVERDCDTVGVYRKSGDFEVIENIISKIEEIRDREALSSFLEKQKIHELACVVKQYLRTINEPLFPSYLAQDIQPLLKQNKIETIKLLKVFVQELPVAHIHLLRALSEHLNVVAQSPSNQMNLKSLAICVSPNFVRGAEQGTALLSFTTTVQTLSQLIFENWRYIFLDEPCQLETHKGKLKQDMTQDDVTVKANETVVFLSQTGQSWTFEFGGKTFQGTPDMFDVLPPCEVTSFSEWIQIKADSVPALKYLQPNDLQHVRSPGAKEVLKKKIEMIEDIERRMYEILDSFDNESERKSRVMALMEEFAKI